MRWSIIRTIWFREMRDQMRDRRTLLMIVGLPLVLYPVLGMVVLQFAAGFTEKPSVIGIVTAGDHHNNFPPRQSPHSGRHMAPALSLLAATPLGQDLGQWSAACVLAHASQRSLDYSGLIEDEQFTVTEGKPGQPQTSSGPRRIKLRFLARHDAKLLEERQVDLILEASPQFFTKLEMGDHAATPQQGLISLHFRSEDDRARLALRRLTPLLNSWNAQIKKVRMARIGLPATFTEPLEIRLPAEPAGGPGRESIVDMMVRIFPVLLVMWCLAGALYPAVDLCAGEKERGTMETLLITPAGREEIVLGKFLTIWVFSFGTALLNLLSMGFTAAPCLPSMPLSTVSTAALLWCVVISLPQSAFFSALALAIGAYARSSKEGQYYLMPLFVISMPLVFLTLAPGVELSPLYSLVPVTGVALLMQKLMLARNLGEIPWAYFVPVLFPTGVYSWLALRWAIEQFNREDVLFREAERLDPMLWLKSLFRDKEPLPTTGQAFFGLALLIGLRWLTMDLGSQWSPAVRSAIMEVVFVAMPPVLMALVLNTQPGEAFYLHLPRPRETGVAALLAILMLPPMIGVAQFIAWEYPKFLEGAHPLITILRGAHTATQFDARQLVLVVLAFVVVPALAEELAFRGFVLRGLHHGFRPRNAILLCSFFFGLFHLNVFLFVPTFLLGVVVGLLTVRSRSLLPAILFHLLYNGVLIALIPLRGYSDDPWPRWLVDTWGWLIGVCVVLSAALVWWLYRKPYVEQERAPVPAR